MTTWLKNLARRCARDRHTRPLLLWLYERALDWPILPDAAVLFLFRVLWLEPFFEGLIRRYR